MTAPVITHAYVVTGPNDPSKEISRDRWNELLNAKGVTPGTVVGLPTGASTLDPLEEIPFATLLLEAGAFSGAYADLTGKPALFSGAYGDLSGLPTLGTMAAQNASAIAVTGGTATLGRTFEIVGTPSVANTTTEVEQLLTRAVTGGVSYQNVAGFALGRWDASTSDPNSKLDIKLKHIAANDFVPDATIMSLLSNGRVGIGTTAPSSRLHVLGSGSFGASATAAAVTTAARAFNLISTDAVVNISRISADSLTAAPAMEFIHYTSLANAESGAADSHWDFYSNVAGFFIRNRHAGNLSPLVIYDAAGDGLLMLTATGVGIGVSVPTEFLTLADAYNIGWGGTTADVILGRAAAAVLRQGGADAASPVAQTLRAQGSRAGTDSNVGGADYTHSSGPGTGTGALSSLILASPIAVASGTGAQTLTEGLRIFNSVAVCPPRTVAQLPAAAANLEGAIAWVTDATATTFLSTVAGSGANKVPVRCDGTNWIIG